MRACLGIVLAVLAAAPVRAEDGYELWLRYRRVDDTARLAAHRAAISSILVPGNSPTSAATVRELRRGLEGLLGAPVPVVSEVARDGTVIAATAASPFVRELGLDAELARVGEEGYLLYTVRARGYVATLIAANTDVGVLYGAFHLLRLLQTQQPLGNLAIAERPLIR